MTAPTVATLRNWLAERGGNPRRPAVPGSARHHAQRRCSGITRHQVLPGSRNKLPVAPPPRR